MVAPNKTFTAKGKGSSEGNTFTFIASTPKVDRSGETIAANWDLDAYAANPVVLYAHDHTGLPIAKATSVHLDGESLMIDVEFVPDDIYPFAGTVRKLYEGGFLNAVSVGFRPLEVDGPNVKHSELLELSAVPIPCNADALLAGRKVIPIYKGRGGEVTAPVTKGADEIKVKAWLSATPAKETMTTNAKGATPADDKAPEAAVESAMTDEKATPQMREILATGLEACEAGDMETCKAAFEAAMALVEAEEAPADDEAPKADAAAPEAAPAKAVPAPQHKGGDDVSALNQKIAALTERLNALDATTKGHDGEDDEDYTPEEVQSVLDEMGV